MKRIETIKFTNDIVIQGFNSYVTKSREDKLAEWSVNMNREDIQSIVYDRIELVVFYWK